MPTTATAPRRLALDGHGEVLTFLETAAESGGTRTLVEVELAAGDGNPLHVHATFDETFEVLEGELAVTRAEERTVLGPGDVAHVAVGTPHRFANDGAARCRFRCAIEPGSTGFEQMQQVAYGLGADGRLRRSGLPRDPRHLALLLAWSDTGFRGAAGRIARPVLALLAWHARHTGEDERLIRRYVRF